MLLPRDREAPAGLGWNLAPNSEAGGCDLEGEGTGGDNASELVVVGTTLSPLDPPIFARICVRHGDQQTLRWAVGRAQAWGVAPLNHPQTG